MKRVEDLVVLRTHWLNYKTYIIEFEGIEKIPEIVSGNFAQIKLTNSQKVFLRRPFSIYDANYNVNTISFFVKVIGEGSRIMGELRKGDKVNVMYPLGNAFTLGKGKRNLIVAGGTGLAPFLLLGKQLKRANKEVTFIFGGKTADDIVLVDEFRAFGRVEITTEDGSQGARGTVLDHPILKEGGLDYDQIYCCGPEAMMKAVSKIAYAGSKSCQVSLENTMACGFGACLCCTTASVRGNICICTEGPVFDINELLWQN